MFACSEKDTKHVYFLEEKRVRIKSTNVHVVALALIKGMHFVQFLEFA